MNQLAEVGVSGFEDAEGLSDEQRRNAATASRIRDRLAEAGLLPETRMPHYRYWQDGAGPMFCYTTERVGTDGDKFEFVSFVYKPVGPGARSGEAATWEPVQRLWVSHSKRKTAKARALRLYKRWKETGRL